MGSTVLWLLVFYKAMTMYEKRTIYFMGLACYSPFPCMLFVINDELIRQVGVWLVYMVSFGSGIGVATSFLLPWVRKRVFFSQLYIKMLILPRQARDKHREALKKETVFLQFAR